MNEGYASGIRPGYGDVTQQPASPAQRLSRMLEELQTECNNLEQRLHAKSELLCGANPPTEAGSIGGGPRPVPNGIFEAACDVVGNALSSIHRSHGMLDRIDRVIGV